MYTKTPQQIFDELTRGLPRFEDGRINFTGVRKAPVLNVVVYCQGEILIVKRSEQVSSYKGLWNGISGFIDEPKPLEAFAAQELAEELSVIPDSVKIATPYEVDDRTIDRIWVVYPMLAQMQQKPKMVLDWEHTDFAWTRPAQLHRYNYVKDFDKSVAKALALLDE